MTGMDRFSEKERRKMRRHNHIARDLRTAKFRQRRVENIKNKEGKYKQKMFDDNDE